MAIFGVSFGNGNDGVNCYSPSYAVELQDSSQAYLLARLAMISQFNDNFQNWANKNLDITGEPEYKISATISEGPEGETEMAAAWLICEVFPIKDLDGLEDSSYYYSSLEECFTEEFVNKFKRED